jgi:hypothetical protein
MVTVLGRALVHGGGAETTLKYAVICLFLFAALGWIVGMLAERTIRETARQRFCGELPARAPATDLEKIAE